MRTLAILAVVAGGIVAVVLLLNARGNDRAAGHRSEWSAAQIASVEARCTRSGVETADFCGCMTDAATRRLSPLDYNRLTTAVRGGARSVDELPADLADDMQAMTDAAEHDCG